MCCAIFRCDRTHETDVAVIVLSVTKNFRHTWERIVDGALVALARHGPHRFSMTDVCAESGVSRGTVYRYFASKDEVLAAIQERLETSLREQLTAAIAADPDPARRLRVVARAIAQHRQDFPALAMLSRNEPGLVLTRLADRFDDLATLLQECLHPVLARVAPVKRGNLTEEQVARLLLQCAIAFGALPTSAGQSADELITTLEGLLGLARAASTSRQPRKAG